MCFGKTFHLILIHFIHKIQCFKEFIHKICWVFKTMIFPKFQLIQSIFPSIEITLKIFSEPLFISINRNWFSINRKLWISFFFFLIGSWLIQLNFFKSFQNFLSISFQLRQAQSSIFLSFSTKFFARFSSLKAGMFVIPFLFHLFSVFHASFHALKVYFRT